jgi:hypothetical protein
MSAAERAKVLLELAERVESEPASMEMWFAAWLSTGRMLSLDDGPKFANLVIAGAYLDAADMLRPLDWRINWVSTATSGHVGVSLKLYGETVTAGADGPHAEARARLAANLRAVAAGGG